MAFEPFGFDVNVHSKLGDDPNVDNNMTADELKALFDSPMVEFKKWINGTLIPALDSFSPESSIAVFIQSTKPSYSPCIWFRPLEGGVSEMSYISKDGSQTVLNVSSDIGTDNLNNNAVTTAKVANKAITPEKLDRAYFSADHAMILKQGVHYGDTLPSPGVPGRLFFKRVM